MKTWHTTAQFGFGTVLLLACLATGVQDFARGEEKDAVTGAQSTTLQLQGTVICIGCFLNEVQEEQPTKAETFTQLSQGQDQIVLQVRAISAPPKEGAFAWPPPQLRVHPTGRVVEQWSAAAQSGKKVAIRGVLHPDQTLDVTDVTVTG
jgi:hypothetical protein